MLRGQASNFIFFASLIRTVNIPPLKQQIEADIQAGLQPFMIVGTAGTTGAGAIDDLGAIANICQMHQLWFHVDAAYGGAIAITSKLRHLLKGIELCDKINFFIYNVFAQTYLAETYYQIGKRANCSR